MGKYRKIDPRIWNDEKFREFTDNGKLVFLFILTHPFMTSVGAMRGSVPGLAAEMGWKERAFLEAFGEALNKGMVKHDQKACFVWAPKFIKYNPPESPNTLKAWEKALDLIPECELYYELLLHIKDYTEGLTVAFREALPEAFLMTRGIPEQEQEQEQEQDNYSCPEPSKDDSRPEEEPIISIQLIKRDGSHHIYQSDVDNYQDTFPGVDVLQELKEIRQWSEDHESRRKTRKGIKKHISYWLSKEQDKAKGTNVVPITPKETFDYSPLQVGKFVRFRNNTHMIQEGFYIQLDDGVMPEATIKKLYRREKITLLQQEGE